MCTSRQHKLKPARTLTSIVQFPQIAARWDAVSRVNHFSCLSHRSLGSSCHGLPRCRLLWHHPRTYIDRAKRTYHVGIMRARTDMSAQNTGGMGGAPPTHDIGIRTDSDCIMMIQTRHNRIPQRENMILASARTQTGVAASLRTHQSNTRQ